MSAEIATPEQLFERVQGLQELLDACEEGPARDIADALVGAVVQMYGAGLEQIMARLAAGEPHVALELTEDPLVATLLLIHDLHPVPLADRVQAALDTVRPYMESHGGGVELLSLQDGVARIHLQGSCSDCSASSVTLELAVKQALEEAAPDLLGIEVEGVAPQTTGLDLPMSDGGAVGAELPMAIAGRSDAPAPMSVWTDFEAAAALHEGRLLAATVAGTPLVVANVEGTLLAYRDACAACGSPLREGQLADGALACPGCGRQFFLPRAGRSMDAERIQLEPVPLLREQGSVRVAVPVAA
ncbi:MAG TPA: NifU family protein [Solirubrobacteraceae bacterium]|nr:NifU family protein [Solirubrobacteraceae bacterium]